MGSIYTVEIMSSTLSRLSNCGRRPNDQQDPSGLINIKTFEKRVKRPTRSDKGQREWCLARCPIAQSDDELDEFTGALPN